MRRSHRVPPYALHLRPEQIVRAAEKLIDRYAQMVTPERILKSGLWFDDVYEQVIYPLYEIELIEEEDLGVDSRGQLILGAFDVHSNSAYITSRIAVGTGDPRLTFTRWHEVGGHGVLQGDWLRSHSARSQGMMVTAEQDIEADADRLLERQANLFAGHAAAPMWLVRATIWQTFGLRAKLIRFVGPGSYVLSVRGVDLHYKHIASFADLCKIIAGKIKHLFGRLSAESLSYHVAESELVLDLTKRKARLYRVA